eukprot:1128600_1
MFENDIDDQSEAERQRVGNDTGPEIDQRGPTDMGDHILPFDHRPGFFVFVEMGGNIEFDHQRNQQTWQHDVSQAQHGFFAIATREQQLDGASKDMATFTMISVPKTKKIS